MSKKNRHGSFGVEPYYLVTMDNGRSSPALDTRADVVAWLEDNFNEDRVSSVFIKKRHRKGVEMQMAEIDSRIVEHNRALEHLSEQRAKLEGKLQHSDSPAGQAM